MENVEKHLIKDFFKELWTKVKPFIPAIVLGAAIIAVVIILTYFYFACSFGFILSDRIADENAIKKSDWLGFWGCVLGVLSTIVFSLLSWKQNKTLNRINDNNRKQEMELSTLRYTSECYSLISLKHLCFFKSGEQRAAMSLEFDNTGRISPNKLRVTNLRLRFKEENDRFTDVFSIKKKDVDIKSIPSTSGFGSGSHVNFQLKEQQYQEAFSYIVQHSNQTNFRVVLDIECMIKNLMKVTTHIKGEYSLNLVELLKGDDAHAKIEEKALFGIVGSFTQTLSYSYTGETE